MIEVTALGIVRKPGVGKRRKNEFGLRPRCRGLSESDGGSDVIKEKEEEVTVLSAMP